VTSEAVESAAARAAALIDLARHGEAVPLLQQALASRPHDAGLLDLLAHAQLHVDPRAAAEVASRLVEAAPQSHRGYLLGSFAAMELGRRRDAVALARQAIELAPYVAMNHAQLAQALAMKRLIRYRRAMRVARRAIELAPESPVGYIAAGNVELASGSGRRAQKWYRKALELQPTDRAARVNLAIADRRRGRLDDAYAGILTRLEHDPRDAFALRLLDSMIYRTLASLRTGGRCGRCPGRTSDRPCAGAS
jgi:tetratricopeptide (TPR) repeat protein